MTYISRYLEARLLAHLKKAKPPFNTILIAGPRQCGKSTMLSHLFPANEHIHINLALDSGFCQAIDETKNFDDFTFLIESRFNYKIGSGRIIIIDEAQFSRRLGAYVRFFKEQWHDQQIILTGSTLTDLFDEHPKPTGRVVEFVLRPFHFFEFLKACQKEALLERLNKWEPGQTLSSIVHQEAMLSLKDYLKIGGLPEVVLSAQENLEEAYRLLTNIYAFYKRDFEHHFDKDATTLFHQCFQRISAATGSPIKNSSIIKTSAPGYQKVSDVLSLLERWHLILKIETELSKLSKVSTTTPKRYLFDHGIRYIQHPERFKDMDLSDPLSFNRDDLGGVIENFVMTELLALNNIFQPKSWSKTHQSGHVDFIFQRNENLYAIEVKAALKNNTKHLSSLKTFHEFFPHSKLILANLNTGGWIDENQIKILNVPVYLVFKLFSEQL